MKKTIRLSESDLHRIVRNALNEIIPIEEGIGDRFSGAVRGLSTGRNRQMSNEDDAGVLWTWVRSAERVAADNNPQEALEWIKRFVSIAKTAKSAQNMNNGNLEYQY